jgi:hypothetical protein
MRSNVRLRTKTYLPSSRLITPVDHRAFGRVADPLENRGFSCVGSSNDEDPEPDAVAGESGEILLRIHGIKACKMEDLSGGWRSAIVYWSMRA